MLLGEKIRGRGNFGKIPVDIGRPAAGNGHMHWHWH